MAVPVSTDVDLALARLRAGGLVAVPTETVYGLAADADDADAVARVFQVKGRPAGHPLIVHVAGAEHLHEWARDVPPAAGVLADACWPGPLTLLLRRTARVLDTVTGGRDTVGIRVPAHPMTLDLLERFGGGLAAPSANRFGRVSPTTAAHVAADLGDVLDPSRDLVLDGGASPVGVESTIVDCTVDPPQVLRPGGIPSEDVARLLGGDVAAASGPSRASGMLAAHYAPSAEVRLARDATEREVLARAAGDAGDHVAVLDDGPDLVTYARTLYDQLRRADDAGATVVVAVLPPAQGLGHAVRDRLLKAAAGSRRDRPSPTG